jgi:hypothetical protein
MTRRHGVRLRAVIGVLCSLTLTPSVRAAQPSTSKAADAKALAKAEATVLDTAVADLRKEYAAHLRDAQAAKMRPQCSYFDDHPVRLSPESLLDALERPAGDDPRAAAYVKWQLLSAAPQKFDAKLLKRVLTVYEKAPAPPARFGLSPEDRSRLDALLSKAKKDDDSALSARIEERVRQDTEANRPILAYRDALYARLPASYESVVAGFRDAHERTQAAAGGGSSDEHAARVVRDALAWAQSGDADAEQCAKLAELVARLRFVRSPPYYARAAWRSDHLAWSSRSDAVYSAKKLSDLENVLRETLKVGKAQQAAQQRKAPTNGKKS